jgi:hypothetical protein
VISRLCCVVLVLLVTGCATAPTETEVIEPASPFSKPIGSSTNYRIGFIGRTPESAGLVAVHLVREVPEFNLRENDFIVARDNDLKPAALLIVQSIKGRVCLAKLQKGRVLPDQEVVLPNSKTREEAETLPLFISGS